MGEYLTHKLIKMAKGKIVDEKVLKYLLSKRERERESNKAINERVVFEIMLHYSSYITISKPQES